MTKQQGHSFLDLAVIPQLRNCLLSSHPVVVFSPSFSSFVWCNASGAQLFGDSDIADLLATRIPPDNPLIGQLRQAVQQMGNVPSIIRDFRIHQGEHSQIFQFSIEKLEIPDWHSAVKVTYHDDNNFKNSDEDELAVITVKAFNGFADAAAILDDHGEPLSHTREFDVLLPKAEQLRELISELLEAEDHLVKRAITSSGGEPVAVGLARLSDAPGRNLVVIARTEHETASSSPENIEPNHHEKTIKSNSTSDNNALIINRSIGNEITKAQDDKDAESIAPPENHPQNARLSSCSLPDGSRKTGQLPKKIIAIGSRFAWTTDTHSRFINVPDELTILLNTSRKHILDKSWAEFASEFGIDNEGEVSRLFKNQHTWSRKVMRWPAGPNGNNLALELAALPVVDNDRQFTGFRVFGKLIDAEAREHSDELAAVPDKATETNDIANDISRFDSKTFNEHRESSNILQFSPLSDPNSTLSKHERENFENVRRHLEKDRGEEQVISSKKKAGTSGVPKAEPKPNTIILDNLPVGILVFRGDEILYANRTFLTVSEYADVNEITDNGGLDVLLDGISEQENSSPILRCADGTNKRINPVIHSVPWGEVNAALMSFPLPDHAAPQNVEILEITKSAEIQSILDTTNDGIVLMQGDGTVISINASGEALFGIDFTQATGKPFEQLFAPESYATIRNYIANFANVGVEHLINDGEEAIALESNGGIIPVFVTITRMKSTGKLCAVLRDITSWKNTEEELIQSRKQAERSSEQKSDFLVRMSHEIRTPLNAIIGFSDVMIEERFGPVNNKRYHEYLIDIKRSGTHVLDIINGLLDLSKIEAGQLDLNFEAVALNELVAETVALLQPQANSSRIIIRTSLSRAVPKVVADPRSIRQIILNLVSNAIKYSRNNSQVIVSTVYETNGEVALRVRDTGKGMTPGALDTAMKPFMQVHDQSDQLTEGTGLGLPLTKALVEANRAYFELESEPDNGTIAHVQFPVQRVLGE